MSPCMTAPIIWLYFFCHFGDHLSQSFEDIETEFYTLPWYMLPVDLQNYWPNMIAMGQQEISLQGFGSASCTRELFMKV